MTRFDLKFSKIMKRQILRALSVEQGEGLQVLLLFLQSLCFGVYLATYEVAATTMFMETFGESMLSKSFIVSGAAGIILSVIYGKLQLKINFTKLAFFNLLLITLFTALIRLGFNTQMGDWLIFVSFIMWGPIMALIMLGFWGQAGRMFNLRQGKRLFSLIDGGQILGIIIITFSTPLLETFIPKTRDLFDVSITIIIVSIALQLLINKKFFTSNSRAIKATPKKEEEEIIVEKTSRSVSYLALFKDKYLRHLSLYMIISVVCAFLIYTNFLDVAKDLFPDETRFKFFYAFFLGTVMIFTFLIKTFLFSKLIESGLGEKLKVR